MALVIGALASPLITFWPRARPPAFFFELTIRSTLSGFAQLYYDIGSGLNEADSARLPVDGKRDADYKFPLPEGRYASLRFDPTDRPENSITLSNGRIVDASGRILQVIRPDQFKAAQQIEKIEAGVTDVRLTTSAGDGDSNLSVDLGQPLVLRTFVRPSWRTLARRFLVAFLLSSALGLLAAPVVQSSRLKATMNRWSTKVRSWTSAHPQQTVLAVAALAVVVSCYPVVFFGKSFVSPNNHSHTFLLYSEMPTVPGYRDVAIDDEKGSDLGAAMWQNFPYSVVESRGLFKYGELPLWNRYNSCGLPLLGQGLSMCADPWQLLVLLTGGSSGAWDLKYILAKFLFVACIGLCVFQAARHLPAALWIAASAPFIGFFPYRYAHPAFFTLCYAPAILLCWFKLLDASPGRATAAWLATLLLADWCVLNSGAVKEGYILVLALNAAGFLTLLLGKGVIGGKGMKIAQVLFANVLFLAIAMPVWLTFFHALQNSLTVYDAGGAAQLSPSLLVGLFDDIFYRQFSPSESHLDPSLNFLVLLAVLWFLLGFRRVDSRGVTWGLITISLIALAFVFGLVPSQWIIRVPLLKNIVHIDNTFSCVAIVCLLVLAGFGIKAFWTDCRAADFKWIYLRVIAVLACLGLLYLGTTQANIRSVVPALNLGEHIPRSRFFWGYSLSLLLAMILFPCLGRFALIAKRARALPIISLALLFILLHWRFGMHLATPFDPYVMNPHRRVNLTADSSDALKLIKTRTSEPSRSVGLDWALFPGYGGAVEIEQMDGPDPVLNKHYRALIAASGARLIFESWRVWVVAEQLAAEPALFNMLNVRYYLGYVGPHVTLAPSFKKIASLDLDVYESERVWPRAFFTDRLVTYEKDAEFIDLLKKGDGTPFAGLPKQEMENQKELSRFTDAATASTNGKATPATDYVFTNNTTSFKVNATGPGMIVLTEAYVPGDFQARVNGKAANYFRVNSAFKGLFVQEAGDTTFLLLIGRAT